MAKIEPTTLIALLHGPDKPGIAAQLAQWIFQNEGNIRHADQHHDREANIFFQRLEWTHPEGTNLSEKAASFEALARASGMTCSVALSSDRPKVAIFVSKIAHCFHDIILRFQAGEIRGDLACVVSNHEDLRGAAEHYGLPFHHIPVSAGQKAEAEAHQIEILRQHDVQLVLLARYMQILSADMISNCGCPVINIHHSFLPAFAGGKPYHQAYQRGVKLIGATAHYATADLDEGPIIQQEIARVSHRQGVRDLIRKGKDLEKSAFAQAATWHLEQRILVYDNKTVVFD
ncbi:MAG: formyltetrahydrofolate deformylase [Opitutales bacterium]|nr:formyltetrahydrofolate deformylase [Opitutales bacterium]NRA25714.1 formyltetrahydrofolate deformylase [Opitutales bacterium]